MPMRSRTFSLLLLLSTVSGSCILPACTTSDESADRYRARWDDRDARYYERMDKRRERSQRMDDRYDAWWDSIMGR